MQFYPENSNITIDPLQASGELFYILSSSLSSISKKDVTLKFAFAGKWNIGSSALKARLRDILVYILDIGHFQIKPGNGRFVITVPLKPLQNISILPNQGIIEVPIVIKLYKKASSEGEELQLKCYQTVSLITQPQSSSVEDISELDEAVKNKIDRSETISVSALENLPFPKDVYPADTQTEVSKVIPQKENVPLPKVQSTSLRQIETPAQTPHVELPVQSPHIELPIKTAKKESTFSPRNPTKLYNVSMTPIPTEEIPLPDENVGLSLLDVSEEKAPSTQEKESSEEEEAIQQPKRVYNGIVTIDFGTTNSVVVVRDPLYAAEEIREDLSKEQWNCMTKWVDSWIIQHLSVITPSEEDLFLEEITRDVSEMDLPPCGSLSVDIWEELQKVTPEAKIKFIMEMLGRFSSFDSEKYSLRILQDLATEMAGGFERSIYSKTLQSQRYFILELDKNAGPGPISSALQIIASPMTDDQKKLEQESQIEMGARVHLLMRSAALREADIRQFAITVKRYFGQDQCVDIVPSEAASAPIGFSPETLCRLAYKKLIERSISDIQQRASKGEFQYADTIQTLVATFPTTYPASLRRKLRDMINELDIEDIDTRFDEGTASAIYYIWRELCADPICGMHGLMARCRRDRHGRSYQNILLYDLGGGTTDIALIQLSYEELPIFEPIDKTETEGGRYFRITPRLLGSTGHRYIGGDLITLWLLRLVKTKLADKLLVLLAEKNIVPPPNSVLAGLIGSLPEGLTDDGGIYRPESLLDWTYTPAQNLRQYEILNSTIINPIVPTVFSSDPSCTPNFFTLWELTEDIKKKLGNPLSTYIGSGLGSEWLVSVELDYFLLWRLIVSVHPWLENSAIQAEDFKISITQEELCRFAQQPILDSLSLAINLAKARLRTHNVSDKLDRFILSGLSCNLKVVQDVSKALFQQNDKLFDFNLANVFFEPEVAKTSVAMGACIGRYLESVRLDPTHEKTRQMLREGYDQVELVVENLFTHLACKLVYDSLVAMVDIFDHGQELNCHSIIDRKPVARTPMNSLRPVQEKFWIYRVDFEGATPQYLGLINAESVAYVNGFEDFRKFREQYVVGFEVDAELFVRAFFMPRGPKNILAITFLEDNNFPFPAQKIIEQTKNAHTFLTHTISSQELFNRRGVLLTNTELVDTIEYLDGSRFRCIISEPLPIRQMYDFYIEGFSEEKSAPQLISHFQINQENAEEVTLACDELGRVILLLSSVYDIKIWADMDYVPQKVDAHYDPFCGQH